MLAYVDNSNVDFTSGGTYEPTTDTLPASAESILYSLNYSEKPLEFSIEIVNHNEAIPFEQMIEIKDWLFGQDGWKKLILEDSDFKDYYLNCLLIPDADIVDGLGYRGVRCTLKNISPFWHRDEVIHFDSEFFTSKYNESHDTNNFITVNVDVKGENPGYISPIIEFVAPSPSYTTLDWVYFTPTIHNYSEERSVRYPDSEIKIDLLGRYAGKLITVDTRHGALYVDGSPVAFSVFANQIQYDWLYLVKGQNKLKININISGAPQTPHPYDSFDIKYVGMYRIGGF